MEDCDTSAAGAASSACMAGSRDSAREKTENAGE